MRTLLAFSCIFFVTKLASGMDTVYMDQKCGQSKDISSKAAIRIKLTTRSEYKPNMDCTFTVTGGYKGEDKLMIYFKDLTTDYDSSCEEDWLSLFDGSSTSSSTIGRSRYCGYSTPSTIYTTSGSDLTFYFSSDDSIGASGFDIILTHFSTDACASWEHTCTNGRCIDDSIACNGFQPCGYDDIFDDACDGDTGAGAIMSGSIIGGSVGGVCVFLVLIITCVIIARRRRLYGAGRTIVAVATVTTFSADEGYSQPVPQEFSVATVSCTAGAPQQNMPPPPPYTPSAN